jgi:hypothetical protein
MLIGGGSNSDINFNALSLLHEQYLSKFSEVTYT